MGETRVDNVSGLIESFAPNINGVGGKRLLEETPLFLQSESEKVIEGPNNSSIVLGRDRNGSIFSGYSGDGSTQAGMIDLVVGRHSGLKIRRFPKDENSNDYVYVNSDFEADAARLYLSQKSNIDEYLGLINKKLASYNDGEMPGDESSTGKSSAAIISDHTRIVGRETVKILTKYFGKNALGGEIDLGGIELIAQSMIDNGAYSLQPIPKGDNLVAALRAIVSYVDALTKIVHNFMKSQMNFNDAVAAHKHVVVSLKPPITEGPMPLDLLQMNKAQINIMTVSSEQLKTASAQHITYINTNFLLDTGPNYINSHWNKVN